jgi:glycosyltransferase involved in cell wall biosynthesis
MAQVRVYLLTHRRNNVLPRALQSLLGQTFADWTCVLHNDAPDDPFPASLVESCRDPRVTLAQHAENLGPNRTFNLVFQPCAESYVCLLEDDNWWEPDFLATLVTLLEENPEIQVAWSNMRVWQETPDGGWANTGRTLWDENEFKCPTRFDWPQVQHLTSLLHSNGSALIRNRDLGELIVPDETPFMAMEPIRERAMHFPLLLCPKPLVNFSWTLATAREKDPRLSAQMSTLIAAAFLKHAPLSASSAEEFVGRARSAPVNELGGLLLAAVLAGRAGLLARAVRLREWPWLVASFFRHFFINLAVLRARSQHRRIWAYLDRHTAKRFREAQEMRATSIASIP